MTDQINFPAIGDPPRLAEETAKADIINRVRTRDDRAGDPTTDLQPTFIGEITALCTDSGDDIARYEWKRIGVLDDGYETAYAEIGLAGAQTDEEYPPLIEVNRLGQGAAATPPGDDPQEPSYKVGDRVLVHRVASDGGDVYMCESHPSQIDEDENVYYSSSPCNTYYYFDGLRKCLGWGIWTGIEWQWESPWGYDPPNDGVDDLVPIPAWGGGVWA